MTLVRAGATAAAGRRHGSASGSARRQTRRRRRTGGQRRVARKVHLRLDTGNLPSFFSIYNCFEFLSNYKIPYFCCQ